MTPIIAHNDNGKAKRKEFKAVKAGPANSNYPFSVNKSKVLSRDKKQVWNYNKMKNKQYFNTQQDYGVTFYQKLKFTIISKNVLLRQTNVLV